MTALDVRNNILNPKFTKVLKKKNSLTGARPGLLACVIPPPAGSILSPQADFTEQQIHRLPLHSSRMMMKIHSFQTVLLCAAQLVLSGRGLTASKGPDNFFYHKFLNETRNKESKCMVKKIIWFELVACFF